MPPKPKYTKEQIVEAAFAIASAEGMDAITIRGVAARIGSSIAPIYVNFDDLEDLKCAVVKRVVAVWDRLLDEHDTGRPILDVALASVRFARQHASLFRDLALTPDGYLPHFAADADPKIIEQLRRDPDLAGLGEEGMRDFLLKMRIFHVGLSVMAANGLLPDLDEAQLVDIQRVVAGDLALGARARQGDGS